MNSALFSQCRTRDKGPEQASEARLNAKVLLYQSKASFSPKIEGSMCDEIYETIDAVLMTFPDSISTTTITWNLTHQVVP
jgi:hypothetical protein